MPVQTSIPDSIFDDGLRVSYPSELPYVHSPGDKIYHNIIMSQSIEPINRNIFLFYARPSYCLSRSDRVLRRIAFLVKLENLHVDKIYPFDSGGFTSGRYSNEMIGKFPMIKFKLSNDTKSITKFVEKFYGNNFRYYYCDPKENFVSKSDLDTAYIDFIMKNRIRKPHDKIPLGVDVISHSIEVQVSSSIDFQTNLVAVVAPRSEFAQNASLRALQKKYPALKIITYKYNTHDSFKEVRENIFAKIADHYTKSHQKDFSNE